MRIQHPRATDDSDREPASQTAVPTGDGSYDTVPVDDDGYVAVDDENADAAMDGFEDQYDVEYDRDTGELVGHDSDDTEEDEGETLVEDGPGEELLEPDSDSDEAGDEDEAEDNDLEEWANWNEEDWLSLGWGARKSDVTDGVVDEHLEDVIEVETSSQVREAAEERLEELDREE